MITATNTAQLDTKQTIVNPFRMLTQTISTLFVGIGILACIIFNTLHDTLDHDEI